MLTEEEKLKLDALHRTHDKELQDVLDQKLYKSIFGDTLRRNVQGVMFGTFAGGIISAGIGLAVAGLLIGLSPFGLGLIGGAIGTFIAGNIPLVAGTCALVFGYKGSEIARSFIAPLSATAGAIASGAAHKEIRERAMEREKLLENISPEQEAHLREVLAKTPMPKQEKSPFYHWKVGLTWGTIAAAVGAVGVLTAVTLAPAAIPGIVAATGIGAEALLGEAGIASLLSSTGVATLAEVSPTALKLALAPAIEAALPVLMGIGAAAMGSIGLSFGVDRSIFQRINFFSDHAATGTLGSVFKDMARAKQIEQQVSRYEAPRPKAFGLTDEDMKELSAKRYGSDFRKRVEEARANAPEGVQIQ